MFVRNCGMLRNVARFVINRYNANLEGVTMNTLLENGFISEMECGSNFAYLLSDNSSFLSTEYKVLQSQADNCFVKCMKMLYNGKVQLFYQTKSLKPFASLIPGLIADDFLQIVASTLKNIIDVKHNGFLSCRNVDISFERIYVEPATHKVQLVYLPLNRRLYDDELSFENEYRTSLVKLISTVSNLYSPRTMQFASDLSDGTLTVEDLYNRIKGVGGRGFSGGSGSSGGSGFNGGSGTGNGSSGHSTAAGTLRIVAMNAPTNAEIVVNKTGFLIGRNPAAVDGAVTFNKLIGRVHCRIDISGGQYTITDLQSSNGTYVNKHRLQPNQPQLIKNGDIIRLANSDFLVKI